MAGRGGLRSVTVPNGCCSNTTKCHSRHIARPATGRVRLPRAPRASPSGSPPDPHDHAAARFHQPTPAAGRPVAGTARTRRRRQRLPAGTGRSPGARGTAPQRTAPPRAARPGRTRAPALRQCRSRTGPPAPAYPGRGLARSPTPDRRTCRTAPMVGADLAHRADGSGGTATRTGTVGSFPRLGWPAGSRTTPVGHRRARFEQHQQQ